MVEERIYNYLIDADSNVDITSVVPASQIGWVDLPELTPYPQIVFKCISKPPMYQSTDQWQRWRFYILSEDKFKCQEIADLLESKLHRAYGVIDGQVFDFITKLDDSPIQRREDSIYEMYVDYRILYH